MQETFPSWLYPVKMGATTIWERWNGIRPDSSFEPASMNSFNHYAYGAIGDWMYRVVAGIDTYQDEPGYKHIRVQPHIGGVLSFASASLQTYYGRLSSSWRTEGNYIQMVIEIPANTKATIYIPAKGIDAISEDGKPLSAIPGLTVGTAENGYVKVETGSGVYHFTINK
jgi:alpha-L-rhamnosidase